MNKIINFLNLSNLTLLLALPIFLTHFRGIADGIITIIAISFLVRSYYLKEWQWLTQSCVIIAFIWWVWLILCTIPVTIYHSSNDKRHILQAIVNIRFFLFVAALSYWLLKEKLNRQRLRIVMIVCLVYIVGQLLLQFTCGTNLYGIPRYFDGTLTGPYDHPRAAAPLSRLFLPLGLYLCSFFMISQKGWKNYGSIMMILLSFVTILALAGQRMPFLLFILGLGVSALWIRTLRIVVFVIVGLIPLIILLLAFISPESFHHLVIHFIEQISHFSTSDYGLIYIRAGMMGITNPWVGLGYDAFKYACKESIYFHNSFYWNFNQINAAGNQICLNHPHNHYLEAFVNGGFPSLFLFILLVGYWLIDLAKGLKNQLFYQKKVQEWFWRIGLFSAIFIHLWPVSSTSSFFNMPLGGWFFLLLGLGLACSYEYQLDTIKTKN